MSARTSPGAAALIFATVALDGLALGLLTPVLPTLIAAIAHTGPAATAGLFGAFMTVFAAMQFFASPIQGALSDRFGRRPVLLASNAALGIDYLIMALAPNVAVLFVGRAISGAASGSSAAAYAYVSDVTAPEQRAARFGFLSAAGAAGMILGPALGGWMATLGPRWPFWAAAALSLANAALCLAFLPESLTPDRRAPFDRRQLNPLSSIAWLLRAHPAMTGLVAVGFLMSLASQGANAIAVLYAGARFGWGTGAIGLLLTAFGLASLVAQGFLVSPLTRALGDRRLLVGGMALTTAGLILFGLAPTSPLFAASAFAIALGSLCGPVFGSILSARVGPDEQGRLQGAWSSINAAMGLAAPAVFSAVFAIAAAPGLGGPWLGVPFLLAAGLMAIAVGLAWRSTTNPPPSRERVDA